MNLSKKVQDFLNWIKLRRVVFSSMGSKNKGKYLRNNSVRLLILRSTVSYDALMILLGTIQKETHKYKE